MDGWMVCACMCMCVCVCVLHQDCVWHDNTQIFIVIVTFTQVKAQMCSCCARCQTLLTHLKITINLWYFISPTLGNVVGTVWCNITCQYLLKHEFISSLYAGIDCFDNSTIQMKITKKSPHLNGLLWFFFFNLAINKELRRQKNI